MKIRHFCFCVIPVVCSLLVYNLQIFLLTLTFIVFYFDLIFAYKLVILKFFFICTWQNKTY